MRVHKGQFERLRRALAAGVVALLAVGPALAAEGAKPAASGYVPTTADFLGVYDALQRYRYGVEKHDQKEQDSAFWEDARRGGGRNSGPPPGSNAGQPVPNAGPPPGANAGRASWEDLKKMPGFVDVWHLPLDSYIHFESATRATHYEYFLSIYPQPEKKGENIPNSEARSSIVGWPGYYEDILEQRKGEWRILQRKTVINE